MNGEDARFGRRNASRDGRAQHGARNFDCNRRGVMRALQTLGYEAKSLDFDERFIESIRKISPDVVFNALHGPGGEDGQMQAILDYLHIPVYGQRRGSCGARDG